MNEPNRLHPEIIKTVLKAAKLTKNEPDDLQKLLMQARLITEEVRAAVGPVAQINPDPRAISQLISKAYLDKFCKWNRDELLMLLTVIHTDIMADQLL